jgi:hypothetical protein
MLAFTELYQNLVPTLFCEAIKTPDAVFGTRILFCFKKASEAGKNRLMSEYFPHKDSV